MLLQREGIQNLGRFTSALFVPSIGRALKNMLRVLRMPLMFRNATGVPPYHQGVPSIICSDISMDFVEEIPCSGNYSSILVMVDRLSKFSYFLPLTHVFIAKQVAKQFIECVATTHGMPESIITDRTLIFLTHF